MQHVFSQLTKCDFYHRLAVARSIYTSYIVLSSKRSGDNHNYNYQEVIFFFNCTRIRDRENIFTVGKSETV